MKVEVFKRHLRDNKKGQALITLIFFMFIGLTITSGAMIMILINSQSGTKQQQGELAYQIALSGAENGMIRLLRTPGYTGEVLNIGSGSATIGVTGAGTSGTPYVLTSTGKLGNFARGVEIRATYINNLLTVTSQKEVF
jgi:hypothetical protein